MKSKTRVVRKSSAVKRSPAKKTRKSKSVRNSKTRPTASELPVLDASLSRFSSVVQQSIGQPRPRMISSLQKTYEQRKNIRVPIQLKVDIESPNNHYLFEYSSNLSESGIFIQTSDPLDPGAEVTIQFALPESRPIRTRGQVIWSNYDDEEPGMGIKFIGLSREDRDQILTALKKLAIL